MSFHLTRHNTTQDAHIANKSYLARANREQ